MVVDLPPGTVKVNYVFGPHGLDLKGDQVQQPLPASQSEVKGVKPGWKILMIDGVEMYDESKIYSTLFKLSKSGKKYDIVFSTDYALPADSASLLGAGGEGGVSSLTPSELR